MLGDVELRDLRGKAAKSRSSASPSVPSPLGEEELDDYESTLELALVQEYKAVVGMFDFAVETDRRFYLANQVAVEVRSTGSPTLLEVTLHDAWVWDMYRAARFVPSVRVLTFRDVNIERLPKEDLQP